MQTTLNKIRANSPCKSGWTKLLSHLGKTQADDEPISIITILDSNGLDDALWCLRAVDGFDKEKRLFAVFCARQVEHLLTDQRSIDAINIAEKFANGEATLEELKAARAAARAAAGDVAMGAARAAARAAAGDAARAAADVAWAAAADAARAAADVAWAAAADAAWAAAWSARAAAADAARAAADAAWDAAADAAWAAAADAARAAQTEELRRICAA